MKNCFNCIINKNYERLSASPFFVFKNKIKKNWNDITEINKDTDKNDVIKLLDDLGFKDSYIVGNIDKKLVEGSNKVLLTKSNLAYLLSRHAQEYSDSSVLLKMKEVIKSNIAIKGRSGKEGDLTFYKLFNNTDDGSIYGIELKMNRKNKYTDEYVVHYLQVREKKL